VIISPQPNIKKRSQFRIKSGFLPNLYKQNEVINIAESPTLKAIHISSRASQRATKTVKEYVFCQR
jgi:hypothetical protein